MVCFEISKRRAKPPMWARGNIDIATRPRSLESMNSHSTTHNVNTPITNSCCQVMS